MAAAYWHWSALKGPEFIPCTARLNLTKIICISSQGTFVFWMDIRTKSEHFHKTVMTGSFNNRHIAFNLNDNTSYRGSVGIVAHLWTWGSFSILGQKIWYMFLTNCPYDRFHSSVLPCLRMVLLILQNHNNIVLLVTYHQILKARKPSTNNKFLGIVGIRQ
jgi:hypothetical protein